MGGKAKLGSSATKVTRRAVEQVWMSNLVPKLEQFAIRAELAGSYRRGVPFIGDMDVVIIPVQTIIEMTPDARELFDKIDILPGKRTSIVLESNEGPVQCDFYIATLEDWGAQMLTWTGSALMNQIMRGTAKKKGYKLNQYGLWNTQTNERIAGENENEIFDKIGMRRVAPEERNK